MSAKLYTPELLGLAVELAAYPPLETVAAQGEARSPTCGSTLALGLALEEDGRIAALGMRVQACAVGQAAAAIFARHAVGRRPGEIDAAHEEIARWLAEGAAAVRDGSPGELDEGGAGDAALPDWPDLALIAPARAYPARHGAILLAWQAARCALSTAASAR